MTRRINLPKPLFEEHGNRAVLILHAYSGSPNDVRMLCRSLEQENYTVYSPMFAGHGTLDPEDILNKNPQQWYQDTKAAIAFLKEKGYQQIAVFGLSMGGIMAMKTLTENDASIIGGGAFCSPIFPTKTNVYQSFLKYAKTVLKTGNYAETEQENKYVRIEDNALQQLRAIETFENTVSQNIHKIDRPVFLAQAGKDQMIEAITVYETAKGLKQTKVTLKWYPESGHVVTIGPERKEFERDIADFLRTLPWMEE
ncbi:MAG TPA: alpha/beta hydrolase [Candidatus Tetragenococcus pullicola]|nr:alpha/beta hydrolase [Candidatus Tetragenococcus pullicola]